MTLRRVLMVLLLRYVVMRWILHSSTYCQTHVAYLGYASSCQAPKVIFSGGQERPILDRGPGSMPRFDERDGRGR
jgi:hypothetical protein